MNKQLKALDKATKGATGKRLIASLATLTSGIVLSKAGVGPEVGAVVGPELVNLLSEVFMIAGTLGVAAFNAINHAKVVDQQSIDTPKP